ncbi:hypothetical protein CYMTET_47862 [Cymbomonas tetramitiformis]|uniref:Uncharacterized protein n=1 Tax=Cymbomonas tetramitiformis TaxID=36881 RepID=A0AAE0BVC1_9CHLO|nr:hypothetical protein CYMTET_47862 [Cymbomonas tetramitiformis]
MPGQSQLANWPEAQVWHWRRSEGPPRYRARGLEYESYNSGTQYTTSQLVEDDLISVEDTLSSSRDARSLPDDAASAPSALHQEGPDVPSFPSASSGDGFPVDTRHSSRVLRLGNFQAKQILQGNTLLLAALKGDLAEVVGLLELGVSVDCRTDTDSTPLMLASASGVISVVRSLLAHGADVTCVDNVGASALVLAAFKGHEDVVLVLLDHARATDPATNGKPFVDHCTHRGETAMTAAAKQGHTAVCQLLALRDATVDAESADGSTPLLAACARGHTETALALIALGAAVSLACPF